MEFDSECTSRDEYIDVIVEAVMEDTPDTKTSLSGGSSSPVREVLWDRGDAIAFFADGAYAYSKFVNQNDQDAQKTAMFAGTVQNSDDYAAFYPYDNLLSLKKGKAFFDLPKVQIYEQDDFADDMFPMLGRYIDGKLFFKNLCGVMVLNLIGEGIVSAISFKGYDENNTLLSIAGETIAAYDNLSEPVIDMSGAKDTMVILDCGEGVKISDVYSTPFHIILPPGQYYDFELIISMTDGRKMIKKGSKPITIRRSERTITQPLTFVETDIPAIDLNSSNETANSYIVSDSGKYKFKAVKGNSSISIGAIESVEVLWESYGTDENIEKGDLIRSVSYTQGEIIFSTADVYRKGNALIAAKDAFGTILWSWHIWLTDLPDEQVYYNNAGIMMDRNLGAISDIPGNVGALGLMYQWGRKDPFLGSARTNGSVNPKSTVTWPAAVSSSVNGSIMYAIQNPMVFIAAEDNSLNGDWFYTGSSVEDNTRWQSEKTIYDPCPAGWRIPDGGEDGIWSAALGASASFTSNNYDSKNSGINFSGEFGDDDIIWYPIAGCRSMDDIPDAWVYSGDLAIVGLMSYYWSITDQDGHSCLSLISGGNTYPLSSMFRGYGLSVRCCKIDSTLESPYNPTEREYEDLSADGTANSYIVDKSGSYKIKTVKGNSSVSVGAVVAAEVLWESFGTDVAPSVGDLVNEVSYADGYIQFSTPSVFKEGNAVIAAKNSSGEILWSWHIWLTDQPKGQVYYNNAGTMMDRNLGATTADAGEVGALGLLYQWGRKDPFLGSSSISSSTEAKSTKSWPSAVAASTSKGNVEFATKNPMTFITGSSSSKYDWHYSSRNDDLWKSSKTIYDPCPAGWRVPDGGDDGVWSKACGSSSDFTGYPYDSSDEGMNFSGKFGSASIIWYPASGYRSHGGGSLSSVGNYGRYWSSTPVSYFAYSLNFYDDGNVDPSFDGDRAYGRPVRCLQE